jgi:hypothetical protein
VWVSPRIATDDHGKGYGVVLVLSKAVPVIVIDARDVGRWGWRTGVGPRKTQISRKEDLVVLVRSAPLLGSVAPRGCHGTTRMITERKVCNVAFGGGPRKARIKRKGTALSVKDRLR